MIVFLMVYYPLITQAQLSKIDSSEIVFNAKIKALNMCYDYFYSIEYLNKLVNECSVKFLKQKGFNNVLFIKVKIRPRESIIHHLFMNNATPKENHLFWGFDSVTKETIDVDQELLMNSVIYRTYGVSINSRDNDYWESKFSDTDRYFEEKNKLENFHDIYYLYSKSQKMFYLLKIDNKYQSLNDDFRRLVYAKVDYNQDWFFSDTAFSIFDDNNLADNPKKKLPNEIFKYIEVEEIGIDFLKQLPPYRKLW